MENELEENRALAKENSTVLREQTRVGNKIRKKTDHYVVHMLSIDAWDAALNEQIIGHIPTDLYNDLQQSYSKIKRTNEHIRRLRVEPLHPNVGRIEDDGMYTDEDDNWTYSVATYQEHSEKVDLIGFGVFLQRESDEIRTDISSFEENLERHIEYLERDLERSTFKVVLSRIPGIN